MAPLSKLTKVSDSFTVNIYDNGYMVEVSGRNADDDWSTVKLVCNTLEDVFKAITQINNLPKD